MKKNVKDDWEKIPALASSREMHLHLRLLRAFQSLRHQVMAGSSQQHAPPSYHDTAHPMPRESSSRPTADADLAWSSFLHRALYRFEEYMHHVLASIGDIHLYHTHFRSLCFWPRSQAMLQEKKPHVLQVPVSHLPPLDVALIWRTYCISLTADTYRLNPSRLYEDTYRQPNRIALALFDFPLQQLVHALGDNGDIEYPAMAQETWERCTGLPFNPFTPHFIASDGRESVWAPCPQCHQPCPIACNDMVYPLWKTACESCSFSFGRDELIGARFLRDLRLWCAGGTDAEGYRMRGGIFSMHDSTFFLKDPFSPILQRCFVNAREHPSGSEDIYGTLIHGTNTPDLLAEQSKYSLEKIIELIWAWVEQTDTYRQVDWRRSDYWQRASHLFYYYHDSHPLSDASFNLVDATLRQFRFIEEVDTLGWLARPDPTDLENAEKRYRAWLALMRTRPDKICPTLDIDLAWHTHMLYVQYYWDCYKWTTLFIDHYDKVEEQVMEEAMKNTERIWEYIYDQPYMHRSQHKVWENIHPFWIASKRSNKNFRVKKGIPISRSPSVVRTESQARVINIQPFTITGSIPGRPGHCLNGPGGKMGLGACLAVDLFPRMSEYGIFSEYYRARRSANPAVASQTLTMYRIQLGEPNSSTSS